MPTKSKQIAIGGISAALCLSIMFMTGMVPFSTYALPSLAGFALIPVTVEMGVSTALIVYAAASLLSLLIVPDREAAMVFIALLGYYPIVRGLFNKIKSSLLRWGLKLCLFNAATIGAYTVIIHVFGLVYLLEDGGFLGSLYPYVLLGIGNFIFILYDYAVRNLYRAYVYRLRQKLIKKR